MNGKKTTITAVVGIILLLAFWAGYFFFGERFAPKHPTIIVSRPLESGSIEHKEGMVIISGPTTKTEPNSDEGQLKGQFVRLSILVDECPINPSSRGKAMVIMMGLVELMKQKNISWPDIQDDVERERVFFRKKSEQHEGVKSIVCYEYEEQMRDLASDVF